MVDKEKVLNAVTKEPASTREIAKKLGLNWYVAYIKLTELALENKIERIEVNRYTFWRKKNGNN